MMNLIEKVYALFVNEEIRIWHYHCAKEKPFEYHFEGVSYFFDTFEEMINEAYSRIDPLLKPLPPDGPRQDHRIKGE
jgi:hypothetical protein